MTVFDKIKRIGLISKIREKVLNNMGLFGNSALRPVKKLADKVEALSSKFEGMSDEELVARTEEYLSLIHI